MDMVELGRRRVTCSDCNLITLLKVTGGWFGSSIHIKQKLFRDPFLSFTNFLVEWLYHVNKTRYLNFGVKYSLVQVRCDFDTLCNHMLGEGKGNSGRDSCKVMYNFYIDNPEI